MKPKRIALYPAGSHELKTGGRDGLEHPLSLSEVRDYIPQDVFRTLSDYYKESKISFRAVIPYHESKWAKLCKGDLALFYSEGIYYAAAIIAFTWYLPELALFIFKNNRTPKGEIWNLFCFLDPWHQVELSKEEVNDAVGYVQDRQLFGFSVIDNPIKVNRIVELMKG